MTVSPLRVVVADDDADIRTLVSIAVRRAGLDLVADVDRGDTALEQLGILRPDIAILDVSMPGLTGIEVIAALEADDDLRGIRVFLLSAAVTDAARQAGIDAGAEDYFFKPFSPRELAARLTELVPQAGRPE
jgi:DNA-binding response OmpR family regulator